MTEGLSIKIEGELVCVGLKDGTDEISSDGILLGSVLGACEWQSTT